jgi:hypothetical protein
MVLLASSYDQSRFLKAADLQREKKFRIKAVSEEMVGTEKQEKKLVVWFTNDERGLVLNKTNNRTIRGAFGDPVNGWLGKIIIVFPTHVDMRGKLTPALRVRIPPPKQAATTALTAAAPPPQQAETAAPAATTPAPQPATTVSTAEPPQQAATAAPAVTTPIPKPAPSGNGAAAATPQTAAAAVVDPELEDDPVKSLSEDLDDEIVF